MGYILVKFRTDQPGFELNGWSVWVDEKMWDSFVDDVKKAKLPIICELTDELNLVWYSVESLLECYKIQNISVEDCIALENLLIDYVETESGHDHIPYDGFMPTFDFQTDWMSK